MFSTKKQLIKKTGKHGVGRFDFLQQLVNEYKATKSRDAKEQVLANLANFAYDPVNYDYLWRLRVLDIFLNAIDDKNKKIVKFAIGGICNICLEPLSREYILRNNGVQKIATLLTNKEETVILSTITTLIFLDTPHSRPIITSPEIIEHMKVFSKSTNCRIKNLADVFLKEFCDSNEIREPVASTSASVHTKKNIKKNISEKTSTITSEIKSADTAPL